MKLPTNILLLGAAIALSAPGQQPVYLDPSQPIDKRVEDLVSRLKPEEKAGQMCTTAPAIERLKIPVQNGWNQCLHGVVWTKPTTMFPVPIGMAATWNPALIQNVAGVIGDEARAVFNFWHTQSGKTIEEGRAQVTVTASGEKIRNNGLIYRSPVINISRDPRWGRIEEAFGEDPFLTSRMTVAFVKGMQGDNPRYLKLAATLKHYAVNNQEKDRLSLSAEVPERMLMEYWLPHFRAGIVEGHAQSIMAAYNAVNGVPCSANKLLMTDILRGRWGFDGFAVPDSSAVNRMVSGHKTVQTIEEAAALTVLAGCDLDNIDYPTAIPKAVAKGLLSESDLDRSLRRIFKVRMRLGEFDPPEMVPYNKIPAEAIDSAAHRELALSAARESLVLLANRNSFLPLDKSKIKTIAVIGPHANVVTTGSRNYTGQASKFVTPIEGIRNRVAPGTEVLYAQGLDVLEAKDKQASFAEAAAVAKRADVAVLYMGINHLLEREGLDREYITLPPVQEELIRKVYEANPKTVLVLLNGGPLTIKWASENVPAILDAFYAGEETGNAIADVLFGNYNPGGRLPYTVYDSLDQLPPMTEYDVTKGFTYMYFDGKPLYPFGHGLSYTTFKYGNVSVSPKRIPGNGQVTVRVEVQNVGKHAGDEVVQLYVHDVQASVKRPKKELRGFERISLKPGEKRNVAFSLPAEKLSFYDVGKKAFVVEPGAFEVMVGSSSEDIRAKGNFEVSTPSQTAN